MGYDKNFISGHEIAMPELGLRTKASAFNNGEPIHHTKYSIIFNQERGFAICTAHNIDGVSVIPEGEIPRKDRFRLDPNVPKQFQVDNDRGYTNNPWDRGHLVRRRALHWGPHNEAELADSESYFWTNITPQHENLHDTAWGNIEDWMLELTDESDNQVSIFTGPVFSQDDPERINKPGELPIRVPAGFWKILAIVHQGALRAAGFLVWQRDYDQPNPLPFDPLLEQVRITTIEYLAGLSFGNLRNADPLRFGAQAPAFTGAPGTLASPAERGSPLASPAGRRGTLITFPGDIIL